MSKKTVIIKDINYYINSVSKGADQTLYKRKVVLYSIVDDLFDLNILPNDLSEINDRHASNLINAWEQNGIFTQTIQNRISILRNMILEMYDIKLASNKDFNLIPKAFTKQSQSKVSRDILNIVKHKVTKSVIDFEVDFGLTRQESININLSLAIMADDLMIHASLATNKKSRFIPILTKRQKEAIDYRRAILGKSRALTEKMPELMITQLVNAEIYCCGYEVNAPFRRIYALDRLGVLSKKKSQAIAKAMVTEELGYANYAKLQKGLL